MSIELRPYQHKAVEDGWRLLKKSDQPILLMASVGAGKSIMISELLLRLQRANRRALCLVANSELVRNNCETFRKLGGLASIYCAALKEKDCSAPVVFASPLTVANAIQKDKDISTVPFSLIVVDECHLINHENDRSAFMRILRHYKQHNPTMRLLGATGTDFRFKGTAIVGEDCLFKERFGNISTSWLIENNYLVKPRFTIDRELVIDFSSVKKRSTGQFDTKQMQEAIDKTPRLTQLICAQIQHVMEKESRFGCFIFASTTKHAKEIYSYLPEGQAAIVLGDTPTSERLKIFDAARQGAIKYIVNIAVVSTGIDIPPFDTIAYLRPTESLVLLVQTIGRGLRLSPNKTECLIMDFAGNIERHQDWDDPIIEDAAKQTLGKESEPVFECPVCSHMNNEHTRRCHGRPKNKRCDYFFVFKECPNCKVENDLSARVCRGCDHELIDPNAKLSEKPYGNQTQTPVLSCEYKAKDNIFFARYYVELDNGQKAWIHERFILSSTASIRYFYGSFMKPLTQDSSALFRKLPHTKTLFVVAQSSACPRLLLIEKQEDVIKVKKRIL